MLFSFVPLYIVSCFTALLETGLLSVEQKNDIWIRKNLEGSSHILIEVPTSNYLEGLGKKTKHLSQVAATLIRLFSISSPTFHSSVFYIVYLLAEALNKRYNEMMFWCHEYIRIQITQHNKCRSSACVRTVLTKLFAVGGCQYANGFLYSVFDVATG